MSGIQIDRQLSHSCSLTGLLATVERGSIYRRSAAHANLRGWHCGDTGLAAFAPAFRQIVTQARLCTDTALHIFFRSAFFVSGDQTVAAAMPGTHNILFKFDVEGLQPISGCARSVIGFHDLNKGGTAVDIALRLNVLAVTAVFVFVGAVLLGAF